METRKMKLLANKAGGNAGKNSYNFRVSLPSTWIRKMGLDEENRDLILEFDGEKITITNNEEKKTMNIIDVINLNGNKLGFASDEREQLAAIKSKITNPQGRLEVLYNTIDWTILNGNRKALNILIESIERELNK